MRLYTSQQIDKVHLLLYELDEESMNDKSIVRTTTIKAITEDIHQILLRNEIITEFKLEVCT